MTRLSFVAALLACTTMNVAASAQQPAAPLELKSPDGSISVSFTPSVGDQPPLYQVTRKGEVVIASSPLGLNLYDVTPFGPLEVVAANRASADRSYKLTATKTATARDHYNELTVSLRERDGSQRKLDIIFRAYDDGAAFRYSLPQQPGFTSVQLAGERTQFNFPADYDCWGLNLGRTNLSHEGEYEPIKASKTRWHNLFDPPFTCKTGSGNTTFILTEADLRDYGALYLRGRNDGGLGMYAYVSPRYDDPKVAVRREMTAAGIQSPWRVVMMADRAGDLIPSTLIGNLNPQNAIGDTSWIAPGKTAWDWWSGPYLPAPAKGGMDMVTLKRYIDFAGATGLPYMLIDEGWSLNSGFAGSAPANTDITKTQPNLDMPELVRYAKARNVDLMLWLQWSLLDKNMSAALDQYRAWGIKGIKVDFMDRDDQEMVAFYHRVIPEAAKRKLLVNLHGAYHPTGLNRTYPNFVTQEGVLGAEYNKWSHRVTATHNVTLPFTRMVLGPLDYTPGGFRNVAPDQFKIVNSPPLVKTTRGQALAMYVVYDSPVQMLSDSPDAYEGAAGLDFLKLVPTAWDETRFLGGDIGEHIVLARRKGSDWYIGAMTNESGRSVTLPLSFLGKGRFSAQIWADGATPTTLAESRRDGLTAADSLTLELAGSGGAAVRITPGR
ncbi:alpha-glucosidase [Sphingomonas oleivorans]|uniref:Alpha-glucosidase n=1 Tax=Sphingomonas oleivorans TaxID=1735121 RepID=A0A2T5G1S9_9SPHN|nr:glycoside hydrolase family 97 protein [Sphingomonas oleivorans]PTQ13088.1 alpha-glucosidase [Sphingomonas oleivorans]